MGLRDRLFGPPGRDRFARMLLDAIRQAGEPGRVRYDPEHFRLVAVRRHQARRHRHDQGGGAGLRQEERPGERGRPRPRRNAAAGEGGSGDPHRYAAHVPMGRTGQRDESADAVVWLLPGEARYITGHTLPVDGGVCSP